MLRRAQGLRAIGSCRVASSNVTQLARSLQRLDLLSTVSRSATVASRSINTVRATFGTRSYATDAATQTEATGRPKKPASEKKATTPRVKKATSATTKSATGEAPAAKKAKSATKAKPKKKKVAKKAAKPKKRVLTEEGKLRKEKRDKAAENKALRVKSLLKEQPQTGHITPFTQLNKEYKGETGPDIGQRSRAIRDQYRGLSSSESGSLNQRVEEANRARDKAMADWIAKYTPVEIVVANNARKLLKRRGVIKRTNGLLIVDERIPKRPITPYAQFSLDKFAAGDLKNLAVPEASKIVSKEWKELAASEKQKYQDLYESDKKRYLRQYKDVFGALPTETDTASLPI